MTGAPLQRFLRHDHKKPPRYMRATLKQGRCHFLGQKNICLQLEKPNPLEVQTFF